MPVLAPTHHPRDPSLLRALYLEEARSGAGAITAMWAHVADASGAVLGYLDERAWIEEILRSNGDDVATWTVGPWTHRLWRITRREAIGELVAQFEDRKLTPLRVGSDGGGIVALVRRGPHERFLEELHP